jgi:hypothetical protein
VSVLLRQPQSFEGLRVIPEMPDGEDIALTHRVDARRLDVRLRAVACAMPDEPHDNTAPMRSVTSSKVSASQVSRCCSNWRMTASLPTNGPGSGQSCG